jgi:hypothetical protein
MRSPPAPEAASWSRACPAASYVPEIPDERWIETTSLPSASSGSYMEVKSPTEGCEVVAAPAVRRRS